MEANDDEIIATEANNEGMSPLPSEDAHVNDSLQEMNRQHPTLRTEANDDGIIATEANDEGMPHLPPEDANANEKRDSLAMSKTNTKKWKDVTENELISSLHACEMVDESSDWIGNEGFWKFELICEECGKSASECLKSDDVAPACKNCKKGEYNKT